MKKKARIEKRKIQKKIVKIFFTFILMILGLYLSKWYPMALYGKDILFDSSAHIVFASFILYVIYFFIDQNKNWRVPFFIFSFSILMVISFQRIYDNAHNDVGLLLGLVIALISIAIPHWDIIRKKIKF